MYRIGDEVDQGEMDRPPEWADKKQKLCVHSRGQWCLFKLQQRLSPEAANDLQGAVVKGVTFDFSKVELVADAISPDGKDVQKWTVTLPGSWFEEGPSMIP